MTTVFYACLYGKFIEIQSKLRRKKLHRTNQGSDFLGGTNSFIFTLIAPVIRLVKSNQLRFSSIEINKPFHALVQCLVDQIQVQKPILVVATDQMSA